MRKTYGPQRLVAYDIEDPAVDVFRIVRSDEPDDPVFVNSLRSNYELSHEPRRHERRSALIHMGISVYMVAHAATETAGVFPKLGGFVARITLRPDLGVNYAETGHPFHLTLWGDPIKLSQAVAEVFPVATV